jgi:hypothetical protein
MCWSILLHVHRLPAHVLCILMFSITKSLPDTCAASAACLPARTGILLQADVTSHLLLLALARRWWDTHRDPFLSFYQCRGGSLWVMEGLLWPQAAFRVVYGSGARLLLFMPVNFFTSLLGPWTAMVGCCWMAPCAFSHLLRQATPTAAPGSLNAWLYAATRQRSWLLVVAGMVFSVANLSLALLLSFTTELLARRAFVRHQQRLGAGVGVGRAGSQQ